VSDIKLGQEFNYNGPAFPFTERNADGSYYYGHGGISMRDWFAGQALAGLLPREGIKGFPSDFAQAAYEYADAMLAAREVKP
jgi:hypothetical protein